MTSPGIDTLKHINALTGNHNWSAFVEWIHEEYESVLTALLFNCNETELIEKRAQAAQLKQIIDTIETAPEMVKKAEGGYL